MGESFRYFPLVLLVLVCEGAVVVWGWWKMLNTHLERESHSTATTGDITEPLSPSGTQANANANAKRSNLALSARGRIISDECMSELGDPPEGEIDFDTSYSSYNET